MFTVLAANRRSCPGFLPQRLRAGRIRGGGVCFYLLEVDPRRPPWKRLCRLLRGSGGRVLCGEGLVPPAGFSPVKTPAYRRYALYEGLSALLTGVSLREETALLVDWDGRFQAFARLLLTHFSSLHVMTGREGYRAFADRAFRLEGAAVTLSRGTRGQPFWAVSPDGFLPPEVSALSCPVFTPDPPRLPLARGVSAFRFPLAAELESLLPPGVCPELFQAAAYEFCGWRGLDGKPPEAFRLNGEEVRLRKGNVHFF